MAAATSWMASLPAAHNKTTTISWDLFDVAMGGAGSTKDLAAPAFPIDWWVLAEMTVAIFILNWGVRLVLVGPLARQVLQWTTGDSHKIHKRGAKLAQSVMEILFYGTFFVVGSLVLVDQPWLWPSKMWWKGCSSSGKNCSRKDLGVLGKKKSPRKIIGL